MTDTIEPQACETCGHIDWKNPIPVVAVIQPVRSVLTGEVGLAVAKRADLGEWALLGGHVDPGNHLEQAAVREWFEETGLIITEESLRYVGSAIAANGKLITVFLVPPISSEEWARARLCHENLAFEVLWSEKQIDVLCFPIHQRFARDWFSGKFL